jgi:predicted CXXCH cytochrome family protein
LTAAAEFWQLSAMPRLLCHLHAGAIHSGMNRGERRAASLRAVKTPGLLVALITLLAGAACAGKDSCFDCHRVMEGTSLRFTNDIHFAQAISCDRCHGGDPNEPDQNIAMNASRGFKVRVTRQGIPAFCGSCHSDPAIMGNYAQSGKRESGNPPSLRPRRTGAETGQSDPAMRGEDGPHPRVDPVAQYQAGVHGQRLAAGRKRAAECVDCHGVHDIRAVADPLAAASPQRVSQTCAKCHAATAGAFARTRHGELFRDARRPGCTVCHAAHDTQPATRAMLTGSTSVCARCHRPGSPPLKLAEDMARVLAGLEAAGPDSKDALARARAAVHSLDLAAVQRAAEPVPPNSGEE